MSSIQLRNFSNAGVSTAGGAALNNTFANFTITGAQYGVYATSSTSADNRIINSTIANSSNTGIYQNSERYLAATNVRIYNSTAADIRVSPWGTASALTLNNVTLDNSRGTFENHTSIYLYDSLPADYSVYTMKWNPTYGSLPPGTSKSFAQKYVNITTTSGTVSIEAIGWGWSDSELAGYAESRFQLWKYNASGWTLMNDTPDTANNMLALTSMNPASTYGIFQGASTCVDLDDDSTWEGKIANASGTLFINSNVTLCQKVYYVNPPGSHALEFNASNIWMNCNQSTIEGVDGNGYGIWIEGKENVTVENCSIRNYEYGFTLYQSRYSRLARNVAFENIIVGIMLSDSDNNTVAHSTMRGNAFVSGLIISNSHGTKA
ncbi:MAG TPA: right-handed parallel beta-helix repeat-containing protein, partial [Candidatus Bilamarchaeaceae archaeon]|nr:right-handed parallel beta-helix repeat-containing protein [Candidatus Bilamarchaeaceae archaeon]